MLSLLCVGAGGAAGAIIRYALGTVLPKSKSGFPFITLIINIAGAFAIGIITALAIKHGLSGSKAVLFLKVGLCGGFTTFSTFSLETFDLLKSGKLLIGLIYIVLSIVLGILAVFAGEKAIG